LEAASFALAPRLIASFDFQNIVISMTNLLRRTQSLDSFVVGPPALVAQHQTLRCQRPLANRPSRLWADRDHATGLKRTPVEDRNRGFRRRLVEHRTTPAPSFFRQLRDAGRAAKLALIG
jgi:hypothetical protein